MDQLTRIQFVVDGNYGRRIHKHLSEDGIEGNFYSINWDKLLDHIAGIIEKMDGKRCIFTKKVFYMGSNPEYDQENLSYYRSLENSGIQRISFPLRSAQSKNGRPAYKEDAVDTSLVFGVAKDFYTSKLEDRFDWLILTAGDGDLAPLAKGLAAEGVRTLVIYYDFSTPLGVTRASQGLLESAAKVVSLENLLHERVDASIKAIFSSSTRPSAMAQIQAAERRREDGISAGIPTEADIESAIGNSPKKDADGWVLVAQLGNILEKRLGAKLPYGIKLKTEIEKHPEKFETKEIPAYSVRLRQPVQKTKFVVIRNPRLQGGFF